MARRRADDGVGRVFARCCLSACGRVFSCWCTPLLTTSPALRRRQPNTQLPVVAPRPPTGAHEARCCCGCQHSGWTSYGGVFSRQVLAGYRRPRAGGDGESAPVSGVHPTYLRLFARTLLAFPGGGARPEPAAAGPGVDFPTRRCCGYGLCRLPWPRFAITPSAAEWRLDSAICFARPWTLAAWVFLTLASCSAWRGAYELGWAAGGVLGPGGERLLLCRGWRVPSPCCTSTAGGHANARRGRCCCPSGAFAVPAGHLPCAFRVVAHAFASSWRAGCIVLWCWSPAARCCCSPCAAQGCVCG